MTDQQIIGAGIAAIVGILVGADANKYRMSPIGWGAFVFLFMIVGLPVYFLVRSKKKKELNEGGF